MKTMKKRARPLQIAAIATAVLLAVSGCTISQGTSGSSGGSTSGAKTTLTFWEYYTGTQLTWLQDQVSKFEKDNPNVRVQLVNVNGAQQDQKLLASVATGTTPDLFINNIVVDYPTLEAGHVFLNLTPYWDKFADKGQFPSGAVWKTDGQVYNLMTYTNLLGMFYNTTILNQYGITSPPKTLNELQADMAKVQAGGKYKALAESGAPTVEGAWLFAPQLLGLGVNYCNFSGPKVEAAFDRIQTWAKKGYTPQSTATWDQNAAWQQFMTGQYAFGLNGNWQLGNVKSANFSYGTTQFPAPTGGVSEVYPGGEGFGIGSKSKHPELAWKFLEQMILSQQGEESVFKLAGSIPMRADVANIPAIKADKEVQPFVKAAQNVGAWPNNTNTAAIQTALGVAVSSVLSGQQSAQQGAQSAISTIKAALAKGGGKCR